MKNVISVVLVIIGTLIGAGFASGKEIYLFFSQFGVYGIWGMVVSSSITSIIVIQSIQIIQESSIEKYQDFLVAINSKHLALGKGMNTIVNIFLLISFYIMIAGFSAYMKQAFQIPIYASSMLFVLICYLVFQKNIQGIMKVNNWLIPLLILFVLYLGLKNIPYILSFSIQDNVPMKQTGWLIYGILYASYNSILLIPVLTSLAKYVKGSKAIRKVGILSGIILFLLAILVYGILLRGTYYTQELELPMIEIVKQFGSIFSKLYGIVIVVSIFTSAFSTGYSFLENVSKTKKSYQLYLLAVCLSGILVAHLGFSTLVQILYPIFGLLGCIQIYWIMRRRFNFRKVGRSIEKKAKN
ncbi:MAG: hypothetical protein ACLU84_08295 [Clostridia bacterium]